MRRSSVPLSARNGIFVASDQREWPAPERRVASHPCRPAVERPDTFAATAAGAASAGAETRWPPPCPPPAPGIHLPALSNLRGSRSETRIGSAITCSACLSPAAAAYFFSSNSLSPVSRAAAPPGSAFFRTSRTARRHAASSLRRSAQQRLAHHDAPSACSASRTRPRPRRHSARYVSTTSRAPSFRCCSIPTMPLHMNRLVQGFRRGELLDRMGVR